MVHDVCALSDIPANGKKAVKVAGYKMLLLRDGADSVHAVEARCSHMNLPLSVGSWDGQTLTCRFHGAKFDGGGKCTKRAWLLGSVGREQLLSWAVTVEDGRVKVEV